MTEHLKLFAYIYGLNDPSFSVSIKCSETVDDLKKAIKKEKPIDLNGVDANRLVLYKVSIRNGNDPAELAELVKKALADKKTHKELDTPYVELSDIPGATSEGDSVHHRDAPWPRLVLIDSRHVESLTYLSLSLFS